MERIKNGFYLKARCIQDSEIAHAPPYVREIWDWLIKEANFKDQKYNGFIVKRGQLFRSYRDIREGLHWMVGYRKEMYNENQTKKAMRFLRKARMIDTSKELGGVMITILNYDKYQNPNNYERTTREPNERTNEEPMKNQSGTTFSNNKDNKEKKGNKYSSAFLEFYSHYPIRVGKDAAWRAWNKRNGDMPPLDGLKLAIDRQKKHKDALKAAGRFCPEWKHPSTWLNQGCWDDECTIERQKTERELFIERQARREKEGG